MPFDVKDEMLDELLAREDATARFNPPAKKEGVGKLAKILFGSGLGADMASTIYGQATGYAQEANPLLKWAGKAASPVGAGMEIGGLMLANKLVGKDHPKVMKALLMALGAAHGGAAAYNAGQISKGKAAAKKFARERPDIPEPVATEYRNPEFFPQR